MPETPDTDSLEVKGATPALPSSSAQGDQPAVVEPTPDVLECDDHGYGHGPDPVASEDAGRAEPVDGHSESRMQTSRWADVASRARDLEQSGDVIVISAPPVLGSDATVLASQAADAWLVSTRLDHASADDAARLQFERTQLMQPPAGLVVHHEPTKVSQAWTPTSKRVLATGASMLVVTAVAIGYALWPITVGLLTVVSCLLLLAWRMPAIAFVLALTGFGAEGTIKELIANEGTPLPVSPEALGALLLDICLFGSILGLAFRDRGARLRAVWDSATRPERVFFGLLAVWLAISVPQILQGGQPSRGLAGFRLTQAYFLAAVGGALAFAPRRSRGGLLGLLFAGCALVSGYAVLRGVIGPSAAERAYALSKLTMSQYGPAFRNVGSFSSSIGMDSYLLPVGVFAVGSALLVRRHRLLASVVAGLCAIGIATSYGRAPLVSATIGLLFIAGLIISRRQLSWSNRWVAAAIVLVVLCGGGAVAILVNRNSTATSARLSSLLSPGRDISVRDRRQTYDLWLRRLQHRPFGAGLGHVGRASFDSTTGALNTTDNSYLKVFVEQGVAVGLVFLLGVVGIAVVLARRLRSLPGERAGLGIAALGGLVAFLVLLLAGEDIEQPGKVVAWTLGGIALSQAFVIWGGETIDQDQAARGFRWRRWAARLGQFWRAQSTSQKTVIATAVVAMSLTPVAFNLARATRVGASIQLYPQSNGPFPAPSQPRYVAALLRTTAAQLDFAGLTLGQQIPHSLAGTRVVSTTGIGSGGKRVRTLELKVSSATPQRAIRLADDVARAIASASSTDLTKMVRARLRQTTNTAQRRVLRQLSATRPSRFVLGPPATANPSHRAADRLVASLPGAFPARPNPWAAGAIGLLVVFLVWLTSQLIPPRAQRPT